MYAIKALPPLRAAPGRRHAAPALRRRRWVPRHPPEAGDAFRCFWRRLRPAGLRFRERVFKTRNGRIGESGSASLTFEDWQKKAGLGSLSMGEDEFSKTDGSARDGSMRDVENPEQFGMSS